MRELIKQNETGIFSEEIMNEKFGKVRIQQEDEKYFFCAVDVCNALGYVNSRAAIKRHCKHSSLRPVSTNGGCQKMSFIEEGDVFRLIAHSKLLGASRFEKWLFEEVLPCIRKYGVYLTDKTLNKVKEDPDWIYEFAKELVETKKQKEQKGKVIEWQ